MTLEDGDVLRITDTQEMEGLPILNIFFYIYDVLVAGVTILDVALEFRDAVMDLILPTQVAALTHDSLYIENLTNGIDTRLVTTGDTGTDATGGTVMPNYTAASYRLFTADRTTRFGGKRIGGIGEDRVVANTYTPGGTTADDAGDAMAEVLAVTGAVSGQGLASPVVVGRDEFGALDLTRLGQIVVGSPITEISTQTTRKAPLT